MTSIHRLIIGSFMAFAGLGFLAGPVAAHTGFESSDPEDGATLDEQVEVVTLVFTGAAEPTGDGFQLLDPTGELREPIEATTADGLTWKLRFDPPIGVGVAGVRWMVKAPDAHPIDGSFSFTILSSNVVPGDEESLTAEPLAATVDSEVIPAPVDLEAFLDTADDPTATPRRVGAVGRAIALSGTLVGIGGLVFAAAVMRGDRRDIRHVLYWVRRAGLIVMVGALVELIGQLGVEGGGDWSAVYSPSTLTAVLASSFGIAVGLRFLGGFALAFGAQLNTTDASATPDPVVAIRELVGVGATSSDASWGTADDSHRSDGSTAGVDHFVHVGDRAWHPTIDSGGAVLGALALLAAHLFDGHTVTKGDRLFTGVVDIVHLTGAAVWVGGVLMITTTVWRRHRQGRELRALQLALRFSVVATLALVAVGAAGLALTVIILDSPSELWSTEWGRLLMLKTLIVAAAASAGAYNHTVLIPLMSSWPDDPSLAHRFRVIITAEAATLVAVILVTALLMGAAS